MGKQQTLASRRLLVSRVGAEAAKKIAGELSNTYRDRQGGYTRIVKMVPRASDAAKQAIIEFV